jgi:hypothetical protein
MAPCLVKRFPELPAQPFPLRRLVWVIRLAPVKDLEME